jgi:RimJ/RimL family protein N-acetyltransferase
MELETARTVLRRWTAADLPALKALFCSDEVMANLGGALQESAVTGDVLPFFEKQYGANGYGPWAVVEKSAGAIIGINGLKWFEQLGAVDLGFSFLPTHWGKGFATETGKAVLARGFEHYGLKRIVGHCEPQNAASVAVMKKLGMNQCGTFMRKEKSHLIFEKRR